MGLKIRLFAGDTTVYMYLTINNSEDCQQFQHDLSLKWGEDQLKEFNASKCKVLRVSRAPTKILYTY